jgi:hypothetical protein
VLASVRAHPVATAAVVVVTVVWLAFSALVAMPPWAVLFVPLLVAALSVALHIVISRRRAAAGPVSDVRLLTTMAGATMIALILIQVVPYGRDRVQPPVTGEPAWADDQTRALMVRACYGCHSSEVEYPAYASIAPISWMVQSHVDEGREKVNYSQFATDPGDADESVEVIVEGEMPPGYYTRFGRHPEAALTAAETQQLIEGLRATPGLADDDKDRSGDEGDDDD